MSCVCQDKTQKVKTTLLAAAFGGTSTICRRTGRVNTRFDFAWLDRWLDPIRSHNPPRKTERTRMGTLCLFVWGLQLPIAKQKAMCYNADVSIHIFLIRRLFYEYYRCGLRQDRHHRVGESGG